jgi:hypothetical protein
MNNYKTLFVVGLVLLGNIFYHQTALSKQPNASGSVTCDGKSKINVYGINNTLESIAKAVNDPSIFSYDSQKRKASCHFSIYLRGTLSIDKQTLEIVPRGKHSNMIVVVSKGKLYIKDSRICSPDNTKHTKYDIVSLGEIEAINSQFLNYGKSSSHSFALKKGSKTILKNCILSGRYIFVKSPEAKIHIEECDFSESIRNFRLAKNVKTIALIDCQPGAFPYSMPAGSRIFLKKNVEIKLSDKNQHPLSGVTINVVTQNRNGVKLTTKGMTNKAGKCKLALAAIDYDYNAEHSFYRSNITAVLDSKSYSLKKKWRPKQKTLEFKKTDNSFIELSK